MSRIGTRRVTVSKGARSAIPWYLAVDATPTVAFQPFYARNMAYSLVNKANPGTSDGYATGDGYTLPNLVLGAGWSGSPTRCVSCDVTVTESSCVIALANVTGKGGAEYGWLLRTGTGGISIMPNTGDLVGYYKNVHATGVTFPVVSGLAVFATIGKSLYINGVLKGIAGAGTVTENTVTLTNSPSNNYHLGGTLAAFALYDSLTVAQVNAITTALIDQYAYPLPHSTKVITAIGNSITNAANSWATLTSYEYNESFTTLNKRALVGARIMVDLDTYVLAAASDNADVIIVEMGVNDDNAGNMVALQAEVEENIAELRVSNPRAVLYWMFLPAYVGNAPGDPLTDKGNIRTAVAAGCAAQGVTYWDTLSDPWILPTDTSDGWHPTVAGHQKVADRVLALLV